MIWFEDRSDASLTRIKVTGIDGKHLSQTALEHARTSLADGQVGECLMACLDVVEQTLLAMSDTHGWPAKHTDTIGAVVRRGLSLGWLTPTVGQVISWLDEAIGRCLMETDGVDSDRRRRDAGQNALELTAVILQLVTTEGAALRTEDSARRMLEDSRQREQSPTDTRAA